MELQCNMALRWFVGLNLDQNAWDASTFSQNRRRRFHRAGVLEKLFDETVRQAMKEGRRASTRALTARWCGPTLASRASCPSKSPWTRKSTSDGCEPRTTPPRTRTGKILQFGAVDFRGEKRSNKTHRSITDPDCRYVSKGSSGTGSYPGYTVNALMENRNRILLGIGAETFAGSASEESGCLALLERARRKLGDEPECRRR